MTKHNNNEISIDFFAGGGGASTGIERALGRPVTYAIDHDPEAIAMHRANHPHTIHLRSDVRETDPRSVSPGAPIGLAWFSPDCTFHSKARGGKPFRDRNAARRVRGLAWTVPHWMKLRRPRVVMLENVEEFADWGPLLPDGRLCPIRRGMTFRRWHRQIENLGYRVDMRELRACDYGAPTIRKRLFVIARCDGGEIVFPDKTHGPGLLPYRTAAECIDWSIPCPSIFLTAEEGKAIGVRRPLADATMRRIARGVMRYVVNNPHPFTAPAGGSQIVAPALINTRNGERAGQAPRVRHILDPYPTVTAVGSQGAIVAVFLARHYGGNENDGAPMDVPFFTITTRDHHALVAAFLRLEQPLGTVTKRDRFGLVTVRGEQYRIVDIGMRMLTPRELYRAQGFPESYVIDPVINGKRLSKTAQIRMCGNSVPPPVAEAIVRANIVEQAREARVA